MRLVRSAVGSGARVVMDLDGRHAVATVDGAEFEDLPALLEAAGGESVPVVPGREVEVSPDELLSVVGAPRKIVCIGLNYRMHAAESGVQPPTHPMLFAKWATSLTGPYDDIALPAESSFVDWESELAFIFGRRARRVSRADAASVVFGYTIANDVSMRDFQMNTSQFLAGKAWDRATPLGPAVVTVGDVGGIEPDLSITGSLNGSVVQNSRTSDLLFSVPALVEYLTTIATMEPGDVVLTGTPSGVGFASDPQTSLADNDVFEVEIDGIGKIRNRFLSEADVDIT